MGCHASASSRGEGFMSSHAQQQRLREARPYDGDNDGHPHHRRVGLRQPFGKWVRNHLADSSRSAVAVCFILAFLCFLHRRRMRMDRLEDVKDVQELDDYGIAPSKPRMPKAPPPAYTPSTTTTQDRTADQEWRRESRRDSADSLTPSLRQAMGVVPRDTLANK